jgi:virginiamycin B lyase
VSCSDKSLVGLGTCGAGACVPPVATTCKYGCNLAGDACRVFTEFSISSSAYYPDRITTGPDGNLWFTESGNIGRVTTAGVVTEFPLPTGTSHTFGIVTGADGNLWFTTSLDAQLGRITTAGIITDFPLAANRQGEGIASGVGGDLWIADISGNIGKASTTGSVTWFSVPTAGSFPFEITRGPDGNVWFTEEVSGKIGRVTPDGTITEFPVYTGPVISGTLLRSLTTGADGNLWVAESDGNNIARVTVSGTVTEFPIPFTDSEPEGLALGRDGNVWFTAWNGRSIGRVTPDGTITMYLTPKDRPVGITMGPDGNLWFLENGPTPSVPGAAAVCRFTM